MLYSNIYGKWPFEICGLLSDVTSGVSRINGIVWQWRFWDKIVGYEGEYNRDG
jgi:hypothetical protein